MAAASKNANAQQTTPPQGQNDLAPKQPTAAERFTTQIIQVFQAEAGGGVTLNLFERVLAQHLFLCVDKCLKEWEIKRLDKNDNNKPPYTWANVNLQKLALDAVHRVKLGLDALAPSHLYPIAYLNSRSNKYDLDLRVGYRGKDYYRRKAAVETPLDVRYELVHKNDKFIPHKKDFRHDVETYDFEVSNPFDRGPIVGGFAYISYKEPAKNMLIMVSEADFLRSKEAAKSGDFWTKFPVEMRYKTLVHRATDNMPVDPRKTNGAAFAYVEAQESAAEDQVNRAADAEANKVDVTIDGEGYVHDGEIQQQPAQDTPGGTEPNTAADENEPGF